MPRSKEILEQVRNKVIGISQSRKGQKPSRKQKENCGHQKWPKEQSVNSSRRSQRSPGQHVEKCRPLSLQLKNTAAQKHYLTFAGGKKERFTGHKNIFDSRMRRKINILEDVCLMTSGVNKSWHAMWFKTISPSADVPRIPDLLIDCSCFPQCGHDMF